MTYETQDVVLPILDLGRRVKITVTVDDKNVLLKIGPRDWQWDRKTGRWIGQATEMPVKLKRNKRKAA